MEFQGGIRRAFSAGAKFDIMEERFERGGFTPVARDQLQIAGGIDVKKLSQVFGIVTVIVDIITSYGSSFMKGFNKGLEGKPFWK